MTYKPEIDGLRAVGVILVLLCHMQLGMAGGYIGVDVFFVISGFLITTILLNSITERKFSLWSFYGRRFVRLYPALILVMLVSFLFASLLFEPSFFGIIARSAKYAITSTANIFFARFQGYFDASAQKQVFLHTWSLGVEWQFYLVWPLIVWCTLKVFSKRVLLGLLFVITIASLVASQLMLGKNATVAYYHMPYRAFELGVGGLLVFFYDKKTKPTTAAIIAYLGLATIFIPAYFYTSKTAFPGMAALLPCIGAAACIYGGKDRMGGALLRLKPVVYVGKISYSVYLVHWPLLIMYRSYIFRDLGLPERVVLLLISLALGAMLYHAIETKITWRSMQHKLLGSAVMVAVVVASTALFQNASRTDEGWPWRSPQTQWTQPQYTRWGGGASFSKKVLGQTDKPILAVFSGDSFAGSLASGLDLYTTEHKQAVELQFSPGCLVRANTPNVSECDQASTTAIVRTKELGVPLVLVESWGAQFSDFFLLQPGAQGGHTPEIYQAFTINNLDEIHSAIGTDSPLILVGTVPYRRWGAGELECLIRPQILPLACLSLLKDYKVEDLAIHQANEMLKQYTKSRKNVYYIDTEIVACPTGICTMEGNASMYSDGFHVSLNGSKLVGQHIMQEVEKILQTRAQFSSPTVDLTTPTTTPVPPST